MKTQYTFVISGGDPLTLQLRGGPPMRYEGPGSTVFHVICTREEALHVEMSFKEAHCKVVVHTHGESLEQKQMRINLLALQGENTFPTKDCPSCPWFDPEISGLCGAGKTGGDTYSEAVIKHQMKSERFKDAYNNCTWDTKSN